jgi:hypothetical protein
MTAAKQHKERRDRNFCLCDPCVLSRQKFAQENKTFRERSAERLRALRLSRAQEFNWQRTATTILEISARAFARAKACTAAAALRL